ncbi:MAG: hypothetical protein KDK37_17575, partial [Leptospiraceae bacterium]|nr:hypothetical protein [Leptospiraceae bacterium]
LKVQLVFRDESGIHNETILNRRFKEKEVLPRSHSMVATAWGLMPSWSEESFPASPGRSGFFVPSLILSGSDSLRATWQSSAGAEFRVDSGEPNFWLSLAEGLQQLSATCTKRYCILGVHGPFWEASFTESSEERQSARPSGPNRSGRVAQSQWEFAVWNSATRCTFQEVSPHNSDWLRICFPDGVQDLTNLRLSDENDTDRLVPLGQRRSGLPDDPFGSSSLHQSGCALIVDPQTDRSTIESLLQPGDGSVLTGDDSALGNGIRDDEALVLSDTEGEICTYRKRKNPNPYPIPDGDEIVTRKRHTIQDRPGAYDVR